MRLQSAVWNHCLCSVERSYFQIRLKRCLYYFCIFLQLKTTTTVALDRAFPKDRIWVNGRYKIADGVIFILG